MTVPVHVIVGPTIRTIASSGTASASGCERRRSSAASSSADARSATFERLLLMPGIDEHAAVLTAIATSNAPFQVSIIVTSLLVAGRPEVIRGPDGASQCTRSVRRIHNYV